MQRDGNIKHLRLDQRLLEQLLIRNRDPVIGKADRTGPIKGSEIDQFLPPHPLGHIGRLQDVDGQFLLPLNQFLQYRN